MSSFWTRNLVRHRFFTSLHLFLLILLPLSILKTSHLSRNRYLMGPGMQETSVPEVQTLRFIRSWIRRDHFRGFHVSFPGQNVQLLEDLPARQWILRLQAGGEILSTRPSPDVLGRSKHLASKLGPTSNSKLLVRHRGTLRQSPSVSYLGNIWQGDD